MDKLAALIAFAEVAKTGSFTRAGNALALGPSAVTKKIAALEQWLGIRVLQRNTHGVALTDDGQLCLDIAQKVLQSVDELEQAVALRRAQPAGQVRIGMPYAMGQLYLAPMLSEFLSKNPELVLDVQYSDEVPDILEQRLDVVVHIGEPRDSRVIAKPLAKSRRVTCASPAYLNAHGVPRTVGDLQQHERIALLINGRVRPWTFKQGQSVIAVPPQGKLTVNSGVALRQAALAGVGLIQCNSILVAPDLASGALLPVLDDCSVESEGLYAVFLENRRMVPRVRVTVDLLEKIFLPYRHGTSGAAAVLPRQ
ncbi:LysR family transcriptional regulator [Pigmentiphaga sp.]|uniref:LysR family transcriptional regulator n=1 Tax=Pigmentiphaga sp. TaxID=1977564 RepID=UPI0025FBC9E6|nr:LysR family transcriptional regulator [Pigmentiphaga sp.]MBX6317261.1 LysR family transcriptional regulator [Pigmentiphaga sp.]